MNTDNRDSARGSLTQRSYIDAIASGAMIDGAMSTGALAIVRLADRVALDMARKGLTGVIGDPMPANLDSIVLRYINTHLADFQQAIAWHASELKAVAI